MTLPLKTIVLCALIFACAALPACGQTAPGTTAPRIAPEGGALAPDFTLPTLDGGTATLSDLQGRPVLLNFWASWCPPCRAEMPYLQSVWEKSKDGDLVMLAINKGEQKQKVRDFVTSLGYTFPIGLDTDTLVAHAYRAYSIPRTFFIDRSGVVQVVVPGAFPNEDMIWELLEGIR
ncbi:redoxin domain-containing protein [Chloroflexota bacterium]